MTIPLKNDRKALGPFKRTNHRKVPENCQTVVTRLRRTSHRKVPENSPKVVIRLRKQPPEALGNFQSLPKKHPRAIGNYCPKVRMVVILASDNSCPRVPIPMYPPTLPPRTANNKATPNRNENGREPPIHELLNNSSSNHNHNDRDWDVPAPVAPMAVPW
jgi:hypothetical protein